MSEYFQLNFLGCIFATNDIMIIMYDVQKVERVTRRVPPFVKAFYNAAKSVLPDTELYHILTDARLKRGSYWITLFHREPYKFLWDMASVSDCICTTDESRRLKFDTVESFLIHFLQGLPMSL